MKIIKGRFQKKKYGIIPNSETSQEKNLFMAPRKKHF